MKPGGRLNGHCKGRRRVGRGNGGLLEGLGRVQSGSCTHPGQLLTICSLPYVDHHFITLIVQAPPIVPVLQAGSKGLHDSLP